MLKLDPHILDHLLAFGGGAVGGVGAAAVTTDLPSGGALDGAHIIGYLLSFAIAMAPIVARRLTSAGAAGDRKRAEQKRAKAAKLPEGAAARVKLEDEADELEAKAAEKEAAGKP